MTREEENSLKEEFLLRVAPLKWWQRTLTSLMARVGYLRGAHDMLRFLESKGKL